MPETLGAVVRCRLGSDEAPYHPPMAEPTRRDWERRAYHMRRVPFPSCPHLRWRSAGWATALLAL